MAWAALIAGSLFGGFIQPITGFGSAMIMVLFLSPALSMTLAPSVTAGVCCALSSVMLWRLRSSVDWRGAFLPVAVYTAVNIAVIRMLDAFDLRLLTIIFGAFLVVLSIYFLFFAKNASVKPTLLMAIVCSSVSGISAGLFSVGGPLMALYFIAASEKRETYVGNLQLLFALTNAVSALMRGVGGFYPISLLPMTLVGIVLINVGERIGARVSGRVNAANFKTVVYIGVGVSGLLTLLGQL